MKKTALEKLQKEVGKALHKAGYTLIKFKIDETYKVNGYNTIDFKVVRTKHSI